MFAKYMKIGDININSTTKKLPKKPKRGSFYEKLSQKLREKRQKKEWL